MSYLDAWMRLKSGTDIRGLAVADGERQPALTPEAGISVGIAFARWLSEKLRKPPASLRVAVGHDSRVTGPALKDAVAGGLRAEQVSVLDCGLCTTPAMFMTTVLADCDAAVMVTASHMPWRQNGYKFFTGQGGLSDGDITQLLTLASDILPQPGPMDAEATPFLDRYAQFLVEKVFNAKPGEKPLTGLHIVVDAGNGAGGFYAQMLQKLGARTDGSQFLDPDGHFPNHIPNPEDKEAMAALSKAVSSAGADLGVIFDADCDRAALVDGQGRAVNRNRLIALVSAILLREAPGSTIVTDSVTSAGLDDFIAGLGGALHRFKRGYHNVINEARRLCAEGVDCPLAMETSGHAALRENFFLDDGMYLVTRLIREAVPLKRQGKALCSLIDALHEPMEADELRIPILADSFRHVGEAALARVEQAARESPIWAVDLGNREGIRVLCGGKENWFLLRLSVHDPLLVLNLESDREGGVVEMLRSLHELLAGVEDIAHDALEKRANHLQYKGGFQ